MSKDEIMTETVVDDDTETTFEQMFDGATGITLDDNDNVVTGTLSVDTDGALVLDDGTVTMADVVATPKVTAAEKETALYRAVNLLDVEATVAAIQAMGIAKGVTAFTLARTAVRDGIDAAAEASGNDPDFDALKNLSTFRNAVDAAVAALGPVAKVAADPTTGPVMAWIRALINAEKVDRVAVVAMHEAAKVGVTWDALVTRAAAHFATHGVTVEVADGGGFSMSTLTDADLDKVLNASRGGNRTRVGGTGPKSDRLGADTFPCNGEHNPLSGLKGWHRDGDIKSHIIQAVTDNGGTATLQQINKAITTAYPQGIKSDGAVRNAFMRGIEGFEMSGTKGNYVCRKV